MKTKLFDYNLPKEFIAQFPAKDRPQSRLMVINRDTGRIEHKRFYDITALLRPGDALVLNDTKVIPARIFGRDKRVREILLIKETGHLTWKAFIKPSRGINAGETLSFKGALKAEIVKKNPDGTYILRFSDKIPLDKIGFPPLPPYVKRDYNKNDFHQYDRERYQTVFAKHKGAIAAPTAGLHFTKGLLKNIREKGITISYITLHTGVGTFRPVRTDFVKDHAMSPEEFFIPEETKETLRNAKRVVAVGTTVVRALETGAESGGGYTNLFIYPPYNFRRIGAIITNFHLPRSTLLMLVSAFAGRDIIMEAYEEAVKHRYRFYSYGDAMFIQ